MLNVQTSLSFQKYCFKVVCKSKFHFKFTFDSDVELNNPELQYRQSVSFTTIIVGFGNTL